MKIHKLHHAQITIPSGAEDKAREFYCGLLGLREIAKPEPLRSRGGFWLDLGNAQVHVSREDNDYRHATKVHVAYQVENLDAVRSVLEDAGIEIKDGIPIPGMRRLDIRDPFGNRIELLELL